MFIINNYHNSGNVVNPPFKNVTKQLCDMGLMQRVVKPEYLEHPEVDPCDPLAHCIVAEICHKINKSIHGLFRTMNGECNNPLDPRLGMALSKLSRLIPPKYDKFNTRTYFQKPARQGSTYN